MQSKTPISPSTSTLPTVQLTAYQWLTVMLVLHGVGADLYGQIKSEGPNSEALAEASDRLDSIIEVMDDQLDAQGVL